MSNGDTPQSPIPAINGTCPDGYIYDPSSDQCFFVTPPVSVTSTGVNLPDVDPKNAGELTGLGTQNSGLAERLALAIWWTFFKLGNSALKDCGIKIPAGLDFVSRWVAGRFAAWLAIYDYIVCLGVDFVGASATRDNPGFWALIGGLISDLLGVQLDGATLYQQLQTRGTLPAMQGVGASLVNLLIGEFTGTASGSGGQIAFSSNVNPATGLPEATLTPAGGVKASQALMGFVLSSAVRQGNIDAIGESLGVLAGHVEKFSEAMRTNLGIGRMLRFALRPIFQDLVAIPLQWAVRKQYRPTLLNVAEAARAFLRGDYQQSDWAEETALAGYSDKRAASLLEQHTTLPQVKELLALRASAVLSDSVFDAWAGRHGFNPAGAGFVRQASDLDPARRVALAIAEHYIVQFGQGAITAQAARSFIDGLKTAGWPLTPGEVTGLEALTQSITVTLRLHPRHLTTGQLRQAFVDGTITLDEYEQHLRDLGYSESDVQTLGIEVLIALQAHQAAAAKHAAAAKKGTGKATTTTAPAPGNTPTGG